MTFLADDMLEGRLAGSRGYDLAARYVAAQLAAIGLQPAGNDGTFFQVVPLLESRLDEGTLAIRPTTGAASVLRFRDDFVMGGDLLRTSARVEAPLVFAGFGVSAPELSHDDYASRDVRGKVVVVLTNAPGRFPSEQRAHHASRRRKTELAAGKGAVGLIFVRTREDERVNPWSRMTANLDTATVGWLTPTGGPADVPEAIQGAALLSAVGCREAVRGIAGHPQRRACRGGDGRARRLRPAGGRRADDPQHAPPLLEPQRGGPARGIGRPPRGDVGRLFGPPRSRRHRRRSERRHHLQRRLRQRARLRRADRDGSGAEPVSERPARSLVFTFVTAEEKGLVGSDYFAANPPAAAGRPITNVNMDMPLLLFPIDTVVAFGAEHSTLGDVATRAAALAGLKLIPDPMPEQTLFVRSDQYSFVKRGVPSVFLVPGFTSSDPKTDGPARFRDFLDHPLSPAVGPDRSAAGCGRGRAVHACQHRDGLSRRHQSRGAALACRQLLRQDVRPAALTPRAEAAHSARSAAIGSTRVARRAGT